MRTLVCSIAVLVLTFAIGECTLAEGQPNLIPSTNNSVPDTYPHISALENAILGQSFPEQPLTERLGRMETKAFGVVSTNPDLSERTDTLDDYTDKHLHKKLLQVDVNEESADSTPDQPEQIQSSQIKADYPRVTALEQAILGQTFVGQPLPDRLSRMEIKAFGSASTNTELSDRTDTLETYAEKKLHIKPLVAMQDGSIVTSSQGQSGGLLAKVGQTLLGMAVPNVNGLGGTFGKGGGLGFGGGGLGGSGMGFGPMGNSLGGTQQRQAAPQEQADPPVPVNKDDPAVYQINPPDPNSKLLVKVGWCEMRVFGHTFSNLHLPERLGQLNKELQFEPGKSNIQLMDDIGLMIKAVQRRKLSAPMNQPVIN